MVAAGDVVVVPVLPTLLGKPPLPLPQEYSNATNANSMNLYNFIDQLPPVSTAKVAEVNFTPEVT